MSGDRAQFPLSCSCRLVSWPLVMGLAATAHFRADGSWNRRGSQMTTMLIAVAGAAGAVLRYRLGILIGVRTFPWATLSVNLSGSFLLAAILSRPAQTRWNPQASAAVTIGLLGAYTTFSTFGYETFELLRNDRFGSAVSYVSASVLGGLLATALGYSVGRTLA